MAQEAKIEKAVKEYAIRRDCYVRKFSSPSHRGVPDRLFITPAGVVFFIEFKAPGKKPTALQNRELTLITAHKGNAHWVDSVANGILLVDAMLKITVQ